MHKQERRRKKQAKGTALAALSDVPPTAPATAPNAVTEPVLPLHEGPNLVGQQVDKVALRINYKIIEHFSKHLYGSPTKAVEELVSNGFDAFAQTVRVFVPGQHVDESVIVWDDGDGMDIAGLKGMWLIADSPKVGDKRVARGPNGTTREMIGKFGIGKLASYGVGGTITHLCRLGAAYYLVRVDLDKLNSGHLNETTSTEEEPIFQLTEEEATEFVKSHFRELPTSCDEMLARAHWTFAAVTKLHVRERPRELAPGWLGWVLGSGMPLRPDFTVFINELPVASRLARTGAVRVWDFGSGDVTAAISKRWKEGLADGVVHGAIQNGSKAGLDLGEPTTAVPFVQFPLLGPVHGTIRLYEQSLEIGRPAEQGRSSGFFIMVRGRLINPNDDKLLLNEPSFGTFYRAQWVLHIDGLDADLLADRERVRSDTPMAKELEILQRAVYLMVRDAQTEREAEGQAGEESGARLPVQSLAHYRDPVATLLAAYSASADVPFDIAAPPIVRRAMGVDNDVSSFTNEGFIVNTQHPFYLSTQDAAGGGAKGNDTMRRYEVLAVSERLLEGYLLTGGLDQNEITSIMSWRDGLLRAIAASSPKSVNMLSKELLDYSYIGGKDFERAIASILNAMGLVAETDGKSGKKDGVLIAPCGEQAYRFTFEAKGSKHPIGNSDADVSGAAAHRDKEGADHAVIVAREFAGFVAENADAPMIITECQSTKSVSIMTVEALSLLARTVRRYAYPLDLIKDILTIIESPAKKLERIRALNRLPTEIDWVEFLKQVWEKQQGTAYKEEVFFGELRQANPIWKNIKPDDFVQKVVAFAQFAPKHIVVHAQRLTITLKQAPDVIIDAIQRTVDPDMEPSVVDE